jgi:hypothetical protein
MSQSDFLVKYWTIPYVLNAKTTINTNQCWSIKNFKSEYITVSITSKQNAGGDPNCLYWKSNEKDKEKESKPWTEIFIYFIKDC